MYFVVAYAYSGLSPVRARPWRTNRKKSSSKKLLFLAEDTSAACLQALSLRLRFFRNLLFCV
jgi:hypothetical protein